MPIPQLLLFLPLAVFLTCGYAESKAKPAPWVGADIHGVACSGSSQGVGPFDYFQKKSVEAQKNLNSIEEAHFSARVESLVSGALASDLDIILNAWPNHHRALLSVARYQLKINEKLSKDGPLLSAPECYFQRAVNFSPKDAVTRSLYGYYLRKIGRLKEAATVYEEATQLAPGIAKIEYAYSLLLIDLKQYDQALIHAKNAYSQGTPPPGLKKKLIALGVWK